MTGAQVHEARKLLGWSADRLDAQCGVAANLILRFERTGRMSPPRSLLASDRTGASRVALIRAVLEAGGIEFTNGDAAGVKLRKPNP